MTAARIGRVVVHAADARSAQRVAERLPDALRAALATSEPRNERDVEQLVSRAARKARA
jgi:hypothetical protein